MDKQKVAEVILGVLQRGALIGEDKRELYMGALMAGFDEVDRQERAETAAKLYEALNTVKEYCASQGNTCKECLLSTCVGDDGCDFFNDNPVDWNLEFLKPEEDANGKL